VPKAEALVEPDGARVAQARGQANPLVLKTRPRQRVAENTAAYPLVLPRWQDLEFAYLERVCVLEQLNHADTLALDLDHTDRAALPRRSPLSCVARFVPVPPRRNE
jgi:hypothetical protein